MYDKKMIKIGRVSMGLAIIANFIPAIYVGLRYGEMPGIATILQIWALVAATYGISWIIQPIAYYPTLGAQAWNQVPMRGKLLQQSVLAVPYLFPRV